MTTDYRPYGSAGTVTSDLATRVRWLRGRCLVERDVSEVREHMSAGGILIPDARIFREHAESEVRIHRGRVLAFGPPARMGDHGPEVPWDLRVGDEVAYVYGVALQKTRTFDMGGAEWVIVSQEEIMAVYES